MSPRDVNFPLVEGFGVAYLSTLQRTEGTMLSVVSGRAEPVPVIGLTFQDIARILVGGASNIGELHAGRAR